MLLMPLSIGTETKYKMVIYTAEREQNSTTILPIQGLSAVLAKLPLLQPCKERSAQIYHMLWRPLKLNNKRMFPPGKRE